ncbi:MAG: hypothetical protein M1817_002589 [Caeruleum heppii]|nr:MAG: hypothetical protein M1817_002589 [Caeruleum heppii]
MRVLPSLILLARLVSAQYEDDDECEADYEQAPMVESQSYGGTPTTMMTSVAQYTASQSSSSSSMASAGVYGENGSSGNYDSGDFSGGASAASSSQTPLSSYAASTLSSYMPSSALSSYASVPSGYGSMSNQQLGLEAPAADAQGYVLPQKGMASTTWFQMGTEFGGGTSCGVYSPPNGMKLDSSLGPGTGPGVLYAAINQLGFGANPAASGGGPGAACGLCYKLTPVGGDGSVRTEQALTFMIVDECPLGTSGGIHCSQCRVGDQNNFGKNFHFDIAADHMNKQQFDLFYKDCTEGQNWKEVQFEQTSCPSECPKPPIKEWGCLENCKNNPAASVCQGK